MLKYLVSPIFKHISLRQKLFLFILSFVMITGMISVYSTFNMKRVNEKYEFMFEKMILINQLSDNIQKSTYDLKQYLVTDDSQTRIDFTQLDQSIQESLTQLEKSLSYQHSELTFLNLKHIYDTYSKESFLSFQKKENGQDYLSHYRNAMEIEQYFPVLVNKLVEYELENNKREYTNIKEKAAVFQNVIIYLLFFLLGISIVFTWRFSKDISRPIQRLVERASKISTGKLEMKDIEVESHDEIGHLTIAFNKMIHNIQKLIKEIKDQARLEALLKEAELKALQAQVNPHFLFNVLSVLMESALIERADKTLSMVEKISGLMRYSLTSFQREVTLKEEIEMIERYVYLQSERFEDRITFHCQFPEEIPLIRMPSMILQPLVENAIIHGVEQRIEGGHIDVSLKVIHSECIIEIIDNGLGMDSQTLNHIFKSHKLGHTGHTTGIGVPNVYERLTRYFQSDKELIQIESQVDRGTKVTVCLPGAS